MAALLNTPEGERQALATSLFLVDVPRSGAQNMALDQRMLERANELGHSLLRIYQWEQPTLSLGYFQKYAERLEHDPSSDIDCIRRATGGGAIVHHHDWTYSIALPNTQFKLKAGSRRKTTTEIGASQQIYDCIHNAVVGWLNDLGLPASSYNGGCARGIAKCNFLCFERRSTGDVVVNDRKVMGSAQRRLHGALLQHGSLLLTRSSHAPSLPGLQQLSNSPIDLGAPALREFAVRICKAASKFLGEELVPVSNVHKLVGNWNKADLGNYCKTTWIGKR